MVFYCSIQYIDKATLGSSSIGLNSWNSVSNTTVGKFQCTSKATHLTTDRRVDGVLYGRDVLNRIALLFIKREV
jgi:hypothetical protein